MDLKLGHYHRDGIEVVDVQGEIDINTAPRLRELLIDLVSKNNYQLVVNLDKVGFLDHVAGVILNEHHHGGVLFAPARHLDLPGSWRAYSHGAGRDPPGPAE